MPIKDPLAKQLRKIYGIPYIPALRFRQKHNEEILFLSKIGGMSPTSALLRVFIQTATRRR